MTGVVRRLKAEAIWVDPEDKITFMRLMLDRKAETGKPQTQESIFKFLLDEFFKIKGDAYGNTRSGKSG